MITYPTVLLLGADGLEIGRVSRISKAPAFFAALKAIADGSGTASALNTKLKKHPKDSKLRLALGRLWALRGERNLALNYLNRVIADDTTNQNGLAAEAMLIPAAHCAFAAAMTSAASSAIALVVPRQNMAAVDTAANLIVLDLIICSPRLRRIAESHNHTLRCWACQFDANQQ